MTEAPFDDPLIAQNSPMAGTARAGLREVDEALAANFDRLSPSQRRVVDYMLTDTRMAAVITGPELAKALHVSVSTVTRAAQNLGFAGYPDLQARLRTQFVQGVPECRVTTALELGESSTVSALRVMLDDAENIRWTVEELDPSTIDTAIAALFSARSVYLFGSRGSHGLALMLSTGFRLLLPDVRVLNQTAGDLVDQLLPLSSRDVLLAFSMRRIDHVAVDVVRQARLAGAIVIVITDHRSSVITRLADIPIVVRSSSPRLTTSYASSASLVNALIIAASLRARETVNPTLERVERLWKAWEVWSPEDLSDGSSSVDGLSPGAVISTVAEPL